MKNLDNDPNVRVVVVTGSGKQFCVGADFKALDFYSPGDKDYVESVNSDEMAKPGYGVRPEYDHDLVWHWGLKKTVIAAINGACAGIAVGLAAYCDLRYSIAGAKFTTSTARLGLPAEYGLAWVLPRIVGISNAADILLTGRVFTAEEADKMGFLNGLFPEETFEHSVMQIARSVAQNVSPIAAAVTKQQLYGDLMVNDVGASVDDSKRLIGKLMKLPDYAEGVAALTQKRPQKFTPFDGSLEDLLRS